MSKKVLILSSSPRKNGNSDLLCNEFMRGAAEAGHQVEKIFLKDKHINYCTGCSVCSMYGKPCPQKDDAAEVVEKMIAADVIVMATPVYFYTMSAQMKTLIDRCCARYLEIKDKEFYFIIAAAEESVPMMERTIDGFRGFLDCLEEPKECGTIYGVGAWKVGEINDKPSMHEAYEMGKRYKERILTAIQYIYATYHRLTLAVIFFALITLLFLDFTGTLHTWFGWMAKIQFLPAVLALNIGVVLFLAVLTLVFGRIYCSVICPLGVFQDIVSRLSAKRKKNRFRYSPALKWLRYGVLGVFVLATSAG